MPKIAVIGERDSILAFRGLGISVFPAKSSEEAREAITTVASGDYAAIFITEDLAEGIEDIVQTLREKPLPTVTFIPSSKGTRGLGIERLRKSVRRAVGADIL